MEHLLLGMVFILVAFLCDKKFEFTRDFGRFVVGLFRRNRGRVAKAKMDSVEFNKVNLSIKVEPKNIEKSSFSINKVKRVRVEPKDESAKMFYDDLEMPCVIVG